MTKTCTKCLKSKPESDFNWRVRDVRRANQCKDCHRAYRRDHYLKNRQKYIDKAVKWSENNPEKSGWRRPIHIKYGLTKKEYDEMVKAAAGTCTLCNRSVDVLVVDHDHACCPTVSRGACGKCVRGLICIRCNVGLGQFEDSTELLEQAIKYLNKSNERSSMEERESPKL